MSDFVAAVQQEDRGAYTDFLGNEGEERIRAAYPGATWERLKAIKRRYDPTNLFHLNQNIPPGNNVATNAEYRKGVILLQPEVTGDQAAQEERLRADRKAAIMTI